MIQCEICGNYFHADDIERCPECDIELCSACYEKHVSKCIANGYCFDEEYRFDEESTIPHICPNCQEELILDLDPDGSARVYCPRCNFIEELDEEQLAELNQCEDDDSEDIFSDNEDDD